MIKPLWAVAGVALLGTAGGAAGAVIVASTGGEEEIVQQVASASPSATALTTPTAAATPSLTASPEPTPSGETPVPIPADWQTYEDPKGRFSIRVPPDWVPSAYSSENNPSWLQFNTPGENERTVSHMTDGVKLSVSVEPKQPGETLVSKAPDHPEQPRLSLESVIVNGNSGVRAEFGPPKGFGENPAAPVEYVFERNSEWILVILRPVGPRTSEYVAVFDELIIRAFTIS